MREGRHEILHDGESFREALGLFRRKLTPSRDRFRLSFYHLCEVMQIDCNRDACSREEFAQSRVRQAGHQAQFVLAFSLKIPVTHSMVASMAHT